MPSQPEPMSLPEPTGLRPYYTSPQTDADGRPRAVLYCGDCREITPHLDGVEAVVSDPPYGMNWNTDSTRFSGGQSPNINRKARQAAGLIEGRADYGEIVADSEPFDPMPWLEYPRVILWGSNHYAARLPVGTSLVWIKKHEHLFGTFLSDAEIGWMKGGHGVYCYRKPFPPPTRRGESGTSKAVHPTQKPIGLMEWCITERARVPEGALILDPYMGSGTTGVACAKTAHPFVGIDIEERYCEIAARRIDAALSAPSLFDA